VSGSGRDMTSKGKHASGYGIERSEWVAAFLFSCDVFEVSLLLFEPHVPEPESTLELRANPFPKSRHHERLNVHGERSRKEGICILVFSILRNVDCPILSYDKLWPILRNLEASRNSPQSGFEFISCFQSFSPDSQRERAGGIARSCVDEDFTLLSLFLTYRSDDHD